MNCVFEQDPLLEIRNLLKLIRAEQKLDWWGDVLKAFQTMLVFTAPAYLAAEACVPSVRNVYMYSFAFDAGMLGAAHGMELPLLFGTHNKHWALQRLSGAHRDKVAAESVSNLLIDNFGSFAHTGSPLPSWPSYEVGKKSSTYLIDREHWEGGNEHWEGGNEHCRCMVVDVSSRGGGCVIAWSWTCRRVVVDVSSRGRGRVVAWSWTCRCEDVNV